MVQSNYNLESALTAVKHVFEKFFAGVDFSDVADTYMVGCVAAFQGSDGLAVIEASHENWKSCPMPSAKGLLSMVETELRALAKEDGAFLENFDPKKYVIDAYESVDEELMFFRYVGNDDFQSVEDVLADIRAFSFWPPHMLMLNGAWQYTNSGEAVDAEGNTIGIRL